MLTSGLPPVELREKFIHAYAQVYQPMDEIFASQQRVNLLKFLVTEAKNAKVPEDLQEFLRAQLYSKIQETVTGSADVKMN